MKNLFLSLLLLPFLSFAQLREKVTIEGDNFKIEYSEVLEQPLFVSYTIPCVYGSVSNSRRNLNFHTNDTIHTSNNGDYYKNVWDKGHMMPAASFDCDKELLKYTFTYLNCALQHKDLNRKQWKYLESYENKLTQYGDVYVEINIIFTEFSEKLESGATVPSYFQKKIYLNGDLYGIWKFPNMENPDQNVNSFKIKN